VTVKADKGKDIDIKPTAKVTGFGPATN